MSSNMGSEGREQRAEAARLDAAIEANLKPESVTPLRQACLLFAESAISMAEVFVRPLEMTARGAFAGPLAGNRRVREPFSSNPGTNGRADPRQGWPLALVSTG